MRPNNALAVSLICCSALVSSSAIASTYGFIDITGNATDISKQLKLNVSEVNSKALFTINNLSPGISSSIANVYFDQGSNSFFADTTKTGSGIAFDLAASSSGVHFANGGSPSNLPGGSTVSFTADDWGSALKPAPVNGVNPGEWVGFLGTFAGGNYAGLLKAIDHGSFRVGLHVISINGQNSDSYVTVSAIPLPAAAWLFGSALLGFVGWSRRTGP